MTCANFFKGFLDQRFGRRLDRIVRLAVSYLTFFVCTALTLDTGDISAAVLTARDVSGVSAVSKKAHGRCGATHGAFSKVHTVRLAVRGTRSRSKMV